MKALMFSIILLVFALIINSPTLEIISAILIVISIVRIRRIRAKDKTKEMQGAAEEVQGSKEIQKADAAEEAKEAETQKNTIRITIAPKPTSDFVPYSYFTRVAGVQYRNTKRDVGGFLGCVRSEPNNKYDKNAIGIYRNDGKLLGYIPKDETGDFREWSDKENLPCVGYIQEGDDVPLFGKVKVIDCDKGKAELLIIKFVRWLVDAFGVKYIPAGFNVSTDRKLRTKSDWLDVLDTYIEEKESEPDEE